MAAHNMPYHVAFCGLSPKDQHLVEVVVTRVSSPRHAFKVLKPGASDVVDIAIVDADNPLGISRFHELRQLAPALVGVFLSDRGMMGDSRYRIERKSLLLRVQKMLEEVVDLEFSSSKVRALPGVARVTATPRPAAPKPEVAAFAVSQPQVLGAEVVPLRALVVDDSAVVREQLQGALKRAGLECDLAENAEQAMGLLQQRAYDVGFLDVVMPGIDGYELCRKIKQNAYTRALPIIMLTSRSSPFDRARGALAGCDIYLTKPIAAENFYKALDTTLSKQFRNDRQGLARRGYTMSQIR